MKPGCEKLMMERFAGGELSGDELAGARSHIALCADCASYVRQLEAQRADFLQKHPFSSFTRAHAPATPLPWYRTIPHWWMNPVLRPVYGLILVAAVALPLVVAHLPRRNDVLYKGSVPLTCTLRRGGEVSRVSSSQRFRAGDMVQLTFPLSQRKFVSMFSIDSRGTVSFYQPDSLAANCSIATGPGPSVSYPASIILDATPGAELVVILISSESLTRDNVAAWAKQQYDHCPDPARLIGSLQRSATSMAEEVAAILLEKE